jgi:hypothetical protein
LSKNSTAREEIIPHCDETYSCDRQLDKQPPGYAAVIPGSIGFCHFPIFRYARNLVNPNRAFNILAAI